MRDGERSERLLTCRTASNGYKHFSAVKRVSRIRLLRIEMIYLDGPRPDSNCAQRWSGGCHGRARYWSAQGRSLTATAPPRELASTSEGSGVVLHGSSWGAVTPYR